MEVIVPLRTVPQIANYHKSARRLFPNRNAVHPRYDRVEILLLRWENDEMGVEFELDDLGKVFESYGFNRETWLIPSENPHLELTIKAANFVKDHESEECLFIVYYGGHASINAARQSTWSWFVNHCRNALPHTLKVVFLADEP